MTQQNQINLPEVKRGDTLVLGCAAQDAAGLPVDLAGITIRAQLRTERGALLSDLVVDLVNAAQGTYELSLPGTGRLNAPAGVYLVDVEYSALVGAGPREMARSTRTLRLGVVAGVTE